MRVSRHTQKPRHFAAFGTTLPNGLNPSNVLQAEQCAQSRDPNHQACQDLAQKAQAQGAQNLGLPPDAVDGAVKCAKSGSAADCANVLMSTHVAGVDLGIYTPANAAKMLSCAESKNPVSQECLDVAQMFASMGIDQIPGGWPWQQCADCARNPTVETCGSAGLKTGIAAVCTVATDGSGTALCGPIANVVGDIVWPVIDKLFVQGAEALVEDVYRMFGGGSTGCGQPGFNNYFWQVAVANGDQFWSMLENLEGHWRDVLNVHGLPYQPFDYSSMRLANNRAPWERESGHYLGIIGLFLDKCDEYGGNIPISLYSNGEQGGTLGIFGKAVTDEASAQGPFHLWTGPDWGSHSPADCFQNFQNYLNEAVRQRWDNNYKPAYKETLNILSQKASVLAQASMDANLKAKLVSLNKTMPGAMQAAETVTTIHANITSNVQKMIAATNKALPGALRVGGVVAQSRQQWMDSEIKRLASTAKANQAVAVAAIDGVAATMTRAVKGTQATSQSRQNVLAVITAKPKAWYENPLVLGAGALGLLAVGALVVTSKGSKK